MQRTRKKKAFTLTELLVVVVVIGVLAAVVLPKYSKMLETRKTTEAESMMAAVRTEQERRCALDKPYILDIDKLVSAKILPARGSKNFDYTIHDSGHGMSATPLSSRMNYTLQMPSYEDGRICCSGTDCNKLNKEYASCDELVVRPDFRLTNACVPEDIPEPKDCIGEPVVVQKCGECGIQTRSYTCNNGHYEYGAWSSCPEKPKSIEVDCPQGTTGKQTKEPRCLYGAWTFDGVEPTGECEVEEKDCAEGEFFQTVKLDENGEEKEPICCPKEDMSVLVDADGIESGAYRCGYCKEGETPINITVPWALSNIYTCSKQFQAEPVSLVVVAQDGVFAHFNLFVEMQRESNVSWSSFEGKLDRSDYYTGKAIGNTCRNQADAIRWCNEISKDTNAHGQACYVPSDATWPENEVQGWDHSAAADACRNGNSDACLNVPTLDLPMMGDGLGGDHILLETFRYQVPKGYEEVCMYWNVRNVYGATGSNPTEGEGRQIGDCSCPIGSGVTSIQCPNCHPYSLYAINNTLEADGPLAVSDSNHSNQVYGHREMCMKKKIKTITGYVCRDISRPEVEIDNGGCRVISSDFCYVN